LGRVLTLRKIAITGGLSSGKSTVLQIFKEIGAYAISADDIVHQLLSPNSTIGSQILHLLGEEILEDGKFDRKKIAKIVFNDRKILNALEQILHPAVLEEIHHQYTSLKDKQKFQLFVAEIPLLYEIEKAHLFDAVIVVECDPSLAQMRFRQKTKQPSEEFEKRMIHQLSPDIKKAKSNYVILNNGDLSNLKHQVENLFQQLTQE
jgi:dephospho-CoA kinase